MGVEDVGDRDFPARSALQVRPSISPLRKSAVKTLGCMTNWVVVGDGRNEYRLTGRSPESEW